MFLTEEKAASEPSHEPVTVNIVGIMIILILIFRVAVES